MTNTGLKRIVSLILVFALVLTTFPITTNAAEYPDKTATLSVAQGNRVALSAIEWTSLFNANVKTVTFNPPSTSGLSIVKVDGSTTTTLTNQAIAVEDLAKCYIMASEGTAVGTYTINLSATGDNYDPARKLSVTVTAAPSKIVEATVAPARAVTKNDVGNTATIANGIIYIRDLAVNYAGAATLKFTTPSGKKLTFYDGANTKIDEGKTINVAVGAFADYYILSGIGYSDAAQVKIAYYDENGLLVGNTHLRIAKKTPATASATILRGDDINLDSINWNSIFENDLYNFEIDLSQEKLKNLDLTDVGNENNIYGEKKYIYEAILQQYKIVARYNAEVNGYKNIEVAGYDNRGYIINTCNLTVSTTTPSAVDINVDIKDVYEVTVSAKDNFVETFKASFPDEEFFKYASRITKLVLTGIRHNSEQGSFYKAGTNEAIDYTSTVVVYDKANSAATRYQDICFKANKELGSFSATYTATAYLDDGSEIVYTGEINFAALNRFASDIVVSLTKDDASTLIPTDDVFAACDNFASQAKLTITNIPDEVESIYLATISNGMLTIKELIDPTMLIQPNQYLEINYKNGSLKNDITIDYILDGIGSVATTAHYVGEIKIKALVIHQADEISFDIDGTTNSVGFLVESIKAACDNKSIRDIAITIPTEDLYIKLGSETMVTGETYPVLDASSLTAYFNKVDSDIRVFYFATAADGTFWKGTIVFKAPKVGATTNVKDITIPIDGTARAATFTIDRIADECGDKELKNISITFSTADVELYLGSTKMTTDQFYDVLNSSVINASFGRLTDDVRVYYTATATDNSIYKGSIVFKALKSGTLTDISAYSIYDPNGSFYGKINAADISAKIKGEYVKDYVITDAQFTYTITDKGTGTATTQTVDIFDGSWKSANAYGSLGVIGTNGYPNGAQKTFSITDTLAYVPGAQAGTVVITYQAYSETTLYTGTITYTVYSTTTGFDVELNLKSRDPFALNTEDTEKVIFVDNIKNVVKEAFGDKGIVNYIKFGKVSTTSAKYGTLYSDSSRTALSTENGYYFNSAIAGTATNPVSALYYVPVENQAGTYEIGYTVYLTFNGVNHEFYGTLTIKTPSDTKVTPDILYQVTTGERVVFKLSDFQDYVKKIGSAYVFDSIKFDSVPSVGTLYYNSTAIGKDSIGNYNFYSSTANSKQSIANVSYLPSGTNYYVELPFTVTYKTSSSTSAATRTKTGTLVIVVTSGKIDTIKYTIKASDTAPLDVDDFVKVCKDATGLDLSHVYFNTSSVSGGKLYYKSNRNSAGSATPYYVASNKTTELADVYFDPSISNGTATFTYSAYTSGGTYLFTGVVEVNFYSITKTPNHKSCVLSAQKMICNGENVSLQAYNIDGYNYIKLRDIAALMAGTGSKFSISTNNLTNEVYCTTGGNYVTVADDLKTGKDQSKTCVASTWAFYVDGVYKSVYVYNIGGYNYFKLRDLGDALNFDVDFNSATNTAIISSSDYRG